MHYSCSAVPFSFPNSLHTPRWAVLRCLERRHLLVSSCCERAVQSQSLFPNPYPAHNDSHPNPPHQRERHQRQLAQLQRPHHQHQHHDRHQEQRTMVVVTVNALSLLSSLWFYTFLIWSKLSLSRVLCLYLPFISFRFVSFVHSFVHSFDGIRFVSSRSGIVFDILAFWFLFGVRIAFNLT